MSLSTPHLIYIVGAYALSVLGLVGLLGWAFFGSRTEHEA
jgi:hypothetical protein